MAGRWNFNLKPVSAQTLALAGLWAAVLDFAVVGVLLLAAVDRWAPPQDLAWKPLDLTRPPGMATASQLSRAAGDPTLCRRA
ncbi:MAG TPA: extensin family protein, partial [Phenylobacterium sp.]